MKTDLLKYDAESIQDLLSQKLLQTGLCGNSIYPGTDVRILMDLFSWSFSVLTYILNTTASNTIFDDVQIYQNLNKIVKLLSYNPQSYKTSHCQFLLKSTSQGQKIFSGKTGNYVIPKFACIKTNKIDKDGKDICYSFIKDFQFSVINGIISTTQNPVLYNGKFHLYKFDDLVQGTDFETFTMRQASPEGAFKEIIDRSGFTVVYQKVNTEGQSIFTQIKTVENIVLDATKDDLVCQVRLNQKKQLSLKFGNGVHGKRLEEGGQLYVIYLVSNKDEGIIENQEISNSQILLQIEGINSTINLVNLCYENLENFNLNYGKLFSNSNLPVKSISYLNLTNINKSSSVEDFETIDQIKQNAPNAFKSGQRLITTSDYKNLLLAKFNHIIDDVYVCNNNDYCINFYGWLKKYDQLNVNIRLQNYFYANACDFNNVYLWLKPKKDNVISKHDKQNILEICNAKKTITTNIVPCNALKYYITPFVKPQDGKSLSDYSDSQKQTLKETLLNGISNSQKLAKIIIIKNKDYTNSQNIKNQVSKIIVNYFNEHSKLGSKINISQILTEIYALGYVNSVKTLSLLSQSQINYVNGLSFVGFTQDLVNFKDVEIFTQIKSLENFQFSELIDSDQFTSYIEVVNEYSYLTKNTSF